MTGPLPTDAPSRPKWILTSPAASRCSLAIAIASALGMAVSVVVGISTLITERPVPWLAYFGVPGAVVIVVGFAWSFALQTANKPSRKTLVALPTSGRIQWLMENIPRRLLAAFVALGVLAATFFVTAYAQMQDGDTSGSGGGCAYRLVEKGVYTCVSNARYEQVDAAGQRLVAGWTLWFYTFCTASCVAAINATRSNRQL